MLRCVLDPRDMVTVETGSFNAPIKNGGVLPPNKPGLGVTMNLELLGAPVASWEE
jgi:L-alanine-DL-glutamate epimerase-like enolase superfamily enzyme